MRKHIWLMSILLILPLLIHGQADTARYYKEIFSGVMETSQLFSSNVPQPKKGGGFYENITGYPLNVKEYDSQNVNLTMDIFEPDGDTAAIRPLVIVCFGGGFLDGNRKYWSIRLICQSLARMGYVVASIDYRLGMNIFDQDLATRAVYRGVQDSRSAIRFFRADAANANTYRIDPNKVFIGGHSAGAFIALHNMYLDKEGERPISTGIWMQSGNNVPDQGCLDCVGNNLGYNGRANGGFSLAGAVGFTSYLEPEISPLMLMFHSSNDNTVPIGIGEPFSTYTPFIAGDDLPTVYGSDEIKKRCDTINQVYQYSRYTNRGHGVHENGTSSLHADIMPTIGQWLYSKYLQPADVAIVGSSEVCEGQLFANYSVSTPINHHLFWEIVGGTILSSSNNEAQVTWDANAGTHKLSARLISPHRAFGNKSNMEVAVISAETNTWIGPGNWSDVNAWSQGRTPLSCDSIIIPNQINPLEVTIPEFQNIELKSMDLGENVFLIIPGSSTLKVK